MTMRSTHTAPTGLTGEVRPPTVTSTRRLLTVAAGAGPAFFAVAGVQMLLRDGFDLRVHPISQLATGDAGWVQMANFVLAGLAMIGLAVAHRRLVREGVGRTAVPILVGVFGTGLVLAGVFVMDPQDGFPVGTPDGPALHVSWHSVAHSIAAAVAFSALAIACLVELARSIRRRSYGAAAGHGIVALVLLMPVSPTGAGIQIAVIGAVAFTWASVLALRLRAGAHA